MKRSYEGSKADNKADMKGAKKAGMSMKKYESSAADKRMDKMGAPKMGKRK